MTILDKALRACTSPFGDNPVWRSGFESGWSACVATEAAETEAALNRDDLRLGKYTGHYANLTSDQLGGLLWLLGEWSGRVRADGTLGGNANRASAALNALREFHLHPLTLDEATALMRWAARRPRGESHVIREGGTSPEVLRQAEEAEYAHMLLDEKGVPRVSPGRNVYSLTGRIDHLVNGPCD